MSTDPAMLRLAFAGSFLAVVYSMLLQFQMSEWFVAVNKVGPTIVCLVSVWGAYSAITESSLALWTPLPWFYAACAAYFGFGPLVYHFGSADAVAFVHSFYPVDEEQLLATNLLNAVGLAATAVGVLLALPVFRRFKSRALHELTLAQIRRLAMLFLVVGLVVEQTVALSNRLGLLSWTLPGAIQHLGTLARVAIILLFVLVQGGYKRYRVLLGVVIVVEFVTALMTFSKLAVIEVLLAVGLGWYLSRPNVRLLLVGATGIAIIYAVILSPFVYFGRIAFNALGVGTATEIVEVVETYGSYATDDLGSLVKGSQGWWTRFSYSNAQAYAMTAYDNGDAGSSIALIAYAFLPRVLFPDKPLMTPGRDFTTAVTGYESLTYTAPGVFGEAYWNGGWWAVGAVAFYVGVVLAGFSAFAEKTITRRRYEYLPVVMIGLTMGYSPNDWFVMTYVGSLVHALVLYVVLRLLLPIVSGPGMSGGQARHPTSV